MGAERSPEEEAEAAAFERAYMAQSHEALAAAAIITCVLAQACCPDHGRECANDLLTTLGVDPAVIASGHEACLALAQATASAG